MPMTRYSVPITTFALLAAGCGMGYPGFSIIDPQEGFRSEAKECAADIAACVSRCSSGNTTSCAVLDVYFVRGELAFQEALHGDKRFVDKPAVYERLDTHCKAGVDAACSTRRSVVECVRAEYKSATGRCEKMGAYDYAPAHMRPDGAAEEPKPEQAVSPLGEAVPNSGPTSAEPAADACAPCDAACLDAADTVKSTEPEKAKELASRACDIEACGHVGTTTLIRCKSYGLLTEVPVHGPR